MAAAKIVAAVREEKQVSGSVAARAAEIQRGNGLDIGSGAIKAALMFVSLPRR